LHDALPISILYKLELEKIGEPGDAPELTGAAQRWMEPGLQMMAFLLVASVTYLVAAWLEARLSMRHPGNSSRATESRVILPIGFATWSMYVTSFSWVISIITSKFVSAFTALSLVPFVRQLIPMGTGDFLMSNCQLIAVALPG